MTKASPARASKRTGIPVPTTLVLSDDIFAPFEALGLGRDAFDGLIQQEQAKGTSQEAFDTMLATEAERATAAKKANEEAEAAAKAEQRKSSRMALAGMALQGLLANVSPGQPESVAQKAVAFADATLDALDAPAEAE